MAASRKADPDKGRLNILVMRSKGQVSNLSISWFTIVFAIMFALAFVAVSVTAINRYLVLYPEHQELIETHRETSRELTALRELYAYQYAVAEDYDKFLKSVGRDEGDGEGEGDETTRTPGEDFIPAGGLPAPVEGPPLIELEGFSLEAWADLFPDPDSAPEQELNVENLKINGSDFSFRLVNESAGTLAQGHLLLLFSIKVDGRIILRPYPNFDVRSAEPDFELGPAYNIRSSKPVGGTLDLPEGAKILEMMVVARSKPGPIVLKKSIQPF